MTDTKTEAAGLVKPLPWKSRNDRVSEAETTFGDYQVAYYEEQSEGAGWTAIFRDGEDIGDFPTSLIAMSAAQADYERRILSALDLTALEAAQAEIERLRADRDSHQREAIRVLASLTAAQERIAVLEGDKRRMDWLVSQHVTVRKPLVYGSRALFVAQEISDADEQYQTTLREQIDAALAPKDTGGGDA